MTTRTTRALLAPLFTLALLAVAGGSVAQAQQSPISASAEGACIDGAPVLELELTNITEEPVVIGLSVGGELLEAALELEPGTSTLVVDFPLGENRSVEILTAEGEFLLGLEYDTETPVCPFLTIADSAECDGTFPILNIDVTNPGNVDFVVDLVVNGVVELADEVIDSGDAVLFYGPFPEPVAEPLIELVDSESGEVVISLPITVAAPDCSAGTGGTPPTGFAPGDAPAAPPAAQPVAAAPTFTG